MFQREERPAQVKALLSVAACALLWSIAGLFIKIIDWNPFWIAGLRSLVAAVFLFFFVRTWKLKWSLPLWGAALANAATMILFVIANKLTTSANAIVLQYLAPMLTAVLGAVFLREKMHGEQFGALALTMIGMVLLFLDRLTPGKTLGNVVALGSAVTFSLMFLFTRMQKANDPLPSLMLSHLLAAVVSLGAAAFSPFPVFDAASVASLIVLGVVQIGLAAVFFSYGIRKVPALTANLISVIEPVFNPLWVFLVLGEKPGPQALLGGFLVVFAVTGAGVLGARRRYAENARP